MRYYVEQNYDSPRRRGQYWEFDLMKLIDKLARHGSASFVNASWFLLLTFNLCEYPANG